MEETTQKISATANHPVLEVCPICHVKIDKFDMGDINGYKFVACKACGSVMADPLVTQTEIDDFFGQLQPEIVHLSSNAQYVSRVKRLLKKAVSSPAGKTMIDVNSHQGYSVVAAQELGFSKIKGIDPYEFFTVFAKKHYSPDLFENVSLAEYAERGEKHDVVLALNALCEQPDVEEYIKNIAKITKTGGMLIMEEPNGNSFFLPKKFTRWQFLEPPINSIFVSREGLTALLTKNGFKITRRFFSWSPFDRFVAVKIK